MFIQINEENITMSAFQGWEVSAAWEDFKFGMKHFSDIERLAMVGEEKWQHGMATFYKPRDYCSIFLVGYSLA